MFEPELVEAIAEDHRALDALVSGDPGPKKRLFSSRDDVTLANPLGLPVKGPAEIGAMLDRVATELRDGEPHRFERVAEYATTDLAYVVEIERTARVRAGSGDGKVGPFSLRATTIWRREDGRWKIAHRHADPITTPRPMASVLERKDGEFGRGTRQADDT